MYQRNAQGWTMNLDFLLLDEISLQVAFVFASLIRIDTLPYTIPEYRSLALVFVLSDAMLILMSNTMQNVVKRGYFEELIRTITHCVFVFAFGTIFMFALQSGSIYSRLTLFLTLGFHIVIGYITRVLWKLVIRKRGIAGRNKGTMLIVLHNETAKTMARYLLEHKAGEYQIVGAVLDKDDCCKTVEGIPVVTSIENAPDYISKKWIDAVYFDCDENDPRVRKLIEACNQMAITVHYHIFNLESTVGKRFVEKVAGTTVITSSLNYANPVQLFVKRMIDILGGIVGSLLALIIIVVVGPIIKKASPGPILYKQERIGKNGKRFNIYKIRSMYMDADERKAELMDQNRVEDGMMFKLDWDPRIIGNEILQDGRKKTGIGEFIRRTSLDEFPQFFNVLLNQMSLVGTRPPTVDEWEKYEYHHRARLACKPGITGLWQVSGRSEITDFEDVVRLDTQYISEWSIAKDIKILLQTVLVVLKGEGAM